MNDKRPDKQLRNGLLALVVGFVALPFIPDRDLGPYQAINPQSVARVVLAVLSIGAVGSLAQRLLGKRYGLLVTGFAAGFVSSSATIASMGLRAKADPTTRNASVAAGLASSVATVVFFGAIVGSVDVDLLVHLAPALGLASLVALVGTYVFARANGDTDLSDPTDGPFPFLPALLVGGASAVLAVCGAALQERLGQDSMVVVSAVAALVDAQSTSASVATLHRSHRLATDTAMLSVVVALTTNTLTKIVMASLARDAGYLWRITLGVVAIAGAAWVGLLLT